MRMAELSARTGVPIPTIKFYLREGLLPPGERTSP
ncbi:MerR family DNA-binding transcriptional regulator, partial [Pseudonocardia sp.]